MSANLLIVEDEALVAEEIAMRLRQMGHSVGAVVDNAQAAFDCVRVVHPDMALVDVQIKGPLSGIDIASRFRTEFGVPVVFLTAFADAETLRQAADTEPFGYIVKPFEQRTLAATLETALRRHRAEAKLAKMERWLATTMNSIGDAVIATDREFRVSFINPTAQRLCGWTDGAAIGRPVIEVLRITDSLGRGLDEAIGEASAEGIAVGLDECQLAASDGRRLPVDDTIAPIRDDSGRINGIVIVFRDATQRKLYESKLRELNAELEEQVRRRTAQLQLANQELTSFSYSIAHDLRAPLRAIIGFAALVIQDHSATLSGEGRRLLDVVSSQAGEMSRMIDDYLRLSGLSHVGLTRTQVDMTQLAREAWQAATTGLARAPQLQLEELPPAFADESLMRQVWVNLLSNAVKFTRTVAEPRVRINGQVERKAVRYAIEDNGVGFDPALRGKLFRVFERLHTRQEFEGNGIGLCIVQRIMHRHEGDVAIDGAPGRGARVAFWLPRNEA